MGIIKAGFSIHKTYKNVGRFREIVSILGRNGFDELAISTGFYNRITNFALPKKRIKKSLEEIPRDELARVIGYRLRKSFEELGPSFVKLGQLISSREDLFPSSFIAEMKLLQNDVPGVPFFEIEAEFQFNRNQHYRRNCA